MTDFEFSVENLSASAGDKSILKNVAFNHDYNSLAALMGPMGGGKSTFLKVLAGNAGKEGIATQFDRASYRGKPLGPSHFPLYIRQKIREKASGGSSYEVAKRRIAEIDAVCEGNDDALCIDEPTTGLEKEDGERLMQRLKEISKTRSVLMVTHNTVEVEQFCDHVALFGGGQIVEHMSRDQFFSAQEGTHAERFLRTGGLNLPSLDMPAHLLSHEHRGMPADIDTASLPDDCGRVWVVRNAFALMETPKDGTDEPATAPTIVRLHQDSVTVVHPSGEVTKLEWAGGQNRPDLDLPAVARVCRLIETMIANGQRIVLDPTENVACAAAIVGSFMVMKGSPPDAAIETAAAKLPYLHFGMRLEQLFWDIDLEFSAQSDM